MHHLHTLAWFIDRLAEGNPVAWSFCIGIPVVLGICFLQDLLADRRKNASVLKRTDSTGNEGR
jgi:hypothetical protein